MSKIVDVVEAIDDAIIGNYDDITDMLSDYLNEEITDGQFLAGMEVYRNERSRLVHIKMLLNVLEREDNDNESGPVDPDAGADRQIRSGCRR
jgi:hypothetical protein